MRESVVVIAALTLLAAVAAFTTPVAATGTEEALKLCSGKIECNYGKTKTGRIIIVIDTSEGVSAHER
jgi:hypothetical protein